MVLTVAASFDRRTVGEADAKAWAAALYGVRWEDARDAVVAHYSDETAWVMPAHVRRIVKRVRSKRIADMVQPSPPPELADRPGDERRWIAAVTSAVGDGLTVPEAVAQVCEQYGVRPFAAVAATGRGRSLPGGIQIEQVVKGVDDD